MDPATLKIVLQLGSVLARSKMVKSIVAGLALFGVCMFGITAYGSHMLAAQLTASVRDQYEQGPTGEQCDTAVVSKPTAGGWTPDKIAKTAIDVGKANGIPKRGWVIIIAAGLVESGLKNLSYGDRDSQGFLQQRPSSGWGTVAQIRNPALATAAFYGVAKHTNNRGLVDVYNWQNKPMGVVAQSVQVSAFPDRYAERVAEAEKIVARVDSGTPVVKCEPDGAPLDIGKAFVDNPSGKTMMDGKAVSRIVAAQILLAEKESGINFRVMQGGFGGSHYSASGTSHNYSGVVDVSPGSAEAEKALREAGFAAWARNVPGRSYVGSGAHVHAVSILDPGNAKQAQLTGSWARGENGLDGGKDPAPHYPWYAALIKLTGAT